MPILSVGGASRLISEILPLMRKQETIAFLINQVVNDSFLHLLQEAEIKVIKIDSYNLYNPFIIYKMIKYLRKYDIIHVHLFPSLYLVALANMFVGKPLVFTEHSTYNKRRGKKYLRPIEKWVYGRYKKIISISKLTENNLKTWLGAKKDDKRFLVVNNGINLDSFKSCRREKVYPNTLIMIARFAPAKDQETIIRAMTLLNDDVHLILVGDGENKSNCQTLAKELGVTDRVHFVGTQTDIPCWIGKADIGIQSSKWEGFGLTAVEMMAGGLPVIASEIDGLKQVVEGAGLLFPCGNHVRLAEIIKDLLSNDDYYKEIKAKCLNRCKEYDISKMVELYLNVYKDIVNEKV